MKLYVSVVRENEFNTLYNRPAEITSEADLARAASFDHIAGKMKNYRRSKDNFISADCLMLDLDNTHSEDPEDWQQIEDVMDAFPDVYFYAVPSRNHMKDKRKKDKKTGEEFILQARPKYHLYFPLSKEVNGAEYEDLIFRVLGLFPYFDAAAIDNAHLFYGVANPKPVFFPAGLEIDNYMETVPEEDIYKSITKYAEERGEAADEATKRLYDHFHIKGNSTPPTATDAPSADGLDWITEQETAKSFKWLEEWAADHGVELGKRYKVPASKAHPNATAICVTCPWEDEHSEDTGEKQTVIMIEAGGQLDFKCRHNHNGRSITWKQYRDKIEYGDPEKWENAAAALRERAAAKQATDPERPKPTPAPTPERIMQRFLDKVQSETYRPFETGITFFDRIMQGGITRQTITLLLAAPASGKTTLCMQIAEEMASRGNKIIFLNLEMSREQMIAKAISARSQKNADPKKRYTAAEIMRGYDWSDPDREAILEEAAAYEKTIMPYLQYNPDGVNADLDKLTEYLDRLYNEAAAQGQNAPGIVIDYLQLLSSKKKMEAAEIIKAAVEALKNYAIKGNTFVIAIVATNREANKKGRMTTYSGLGASAIEYTGDYLLTLNYYKLDKNKVDPEDPAAVDNLKKESYRQMILRLEKNRLGASGMTENIYFYAKGNTFYDPAGYMPADPEIIPFPSIGN